jgi:hypothetical protein
MKIISPLEYDVAKEKAEEKRRILVTLTSLIHDVPRLMITYYS